MKNKGQKTKVKISLRSVWRSLLILSISVVFFEATTSFSFIGSYDIKANILTVDNFGNFYATSGNKLFKFSPDGAFLYSYEEFKYGKIEMVDVSNPMKILVFYPDFLNAVTLDKFLAPLSTYNFFDLGYQNVSAVGSSLDGYLWFYDNTDFKLKKTDETGKILLESQPLNVLVDAVPTPNFIVEKDNSIYVNDPNIGIMVFDIFGSYGKTIPLKGLKKFQVFQDQVIYFEGNQLNAYHLITLNLRSLNLPDSTDISMAAIQKNRLGVLKKDRIDFYRY